MAFAADVQQFQLSDLVIAGTGVNITDVPFFGKFLIPDLNFVISSKQFSTANLPNLKVTGVHVPKELLLESIPAGVKGQFSVDIGSAVGVSADYSDDVLTMEVPPSVSLSLQIKSLLSVIPEIKSAVDSLPSTVRDILSAKITKLVFKPATKDLFISLSVNTLTLVPNIVIITEPQISLDVSITSSQLVVQELQAARTVWPYRYLNNERLVPSFPKGSAEVQAVSVNTLDMSGTCFFSWK